MRILPILTIASLLTSLAAAQALEDRTIRFRNAATDQDFQDLTIAALTISGLKAKSVDVATRELSFSGSRDQVRVTEWVLAELDRPVSSTPPPPSNLYTLQTKEPEDSVRVFYLGQLSTTQDLMEVSTAIRTISDIRYVGLFSSHRAIVLRGTREQLDLIEWLLPEMNSPSPRQTYVFPKIAAGETPPRGADENQVHVFRYERARDVQQFNEVQTMIRTLTDTRRVYPYIGKRAIVLRGSEEQVEMTKWILAQLEKDLPLAQKISSGDYATKAGDVMRMFYFDGNMSSQAFLDAGTAIRTATGIRRAFPFASARTFAVRGTATQIAQAAALASQ